MTKTVMIHIRVEPDVKEQSETILKRLGLNMSYAISLFLNQVIMRNGLPFDVELSEGQTEAERLAEAIGSTGGNGTVSLKNQRIIHLLATGQIDYETAVFAIEKNISSQQNANE
ncbi:MAG: type II toxin-antitoxin system RelB/DinJ family antitoxin [Candidatus Methanomethylophilus sp.]|nr:type II toxin-antitoxin system RelB/DinJ family antitoxin [Methanomethylophilus sp.]